MFVEVPLQGKRICKHENKGIMKKIQNQVEKKHTKMKLQRNDVKTLSCRKIITEFVKWCNN